MSFEIEFHTVEEAQMLGIELDKAIALKPEHQSESGPSICPPERTAFWLRAHIDAGDIKLGTYTQKCDVLAENEQVGKAWKTTDMVFTAKSL